MLGLVHYYRGKRRQINADYVFPQNWLLSPHPFLDEVVAAIYSSPLIYDKLLSIVDHAKDGLLEIESLATNCISNLHPWGMIKMLIEEESGRIKHIFL